MAISFNAQFVSVAKKPWGWFVRWSVDEDLEAERYLALQRADTVSEEKRRWGMDGVYVECCGQGWSWYDHIVSFELARDRVRTQLDSEAADRMRDDGRIEATFSLSDERFVQLRHALRDIFRERDYYMDTAA